MESEIDLIPAAALEFEPKEEDIFITVKLEWQRLIFGGDIALTEDEAMIYEVFFEYISDNKIEIPEEYDLWEQFRFYQGCGFDIIWTIQSINEHV